MPSKINFNLFNTAEGQRIYGSDSALWRLFGPYLSERQWGTVREDYSANGSAWEYLPHERARSYAYRRGEDGIAGFSDQNLNWCFNLACWNGHDPIIKERLFGLSNAEGNHGEDVKELYFYLDALPSHSYLKMLYRYPHNYFPYKQLVEENRRRSTLQSEFEILDTGIFDHTRYFDIQVEYAKAAYNDILMKITVKNCGDVAANIDVLPHLLTHQAHQPIQKTSNHINHPDKVVFKLVNDHVHGIRNGATEYIFSACADFNTRVESRWLFCDNRTRPEKFCTKSVCCSKIKYKDGINNYLIESDNEGIDLSSGSKCAFHVKLNIAPHDQASIRLRMSPHVPAKISSKNNNLIDENNDCVNFLKRDEFDFILAQRHNECDAFYSVLQSKIKSCDARRVHRQALAGLIWSKQYYSFDVDEWLNESVHCCQTIIKPDRSISPRQSGRNYDWRHLSNADIIAMPDKWEYPWYASWDSAFHAVIYSQIDPEFAKQQLLLLVEDRYMHPNGQLPAYEWAFSDANPPVHAWAAWRVYENEKAMGRPADREFLAKILHKLMLNFAWWVNRKDLLGRNVFQGGFLGLDNIEVFNRSAPLPMGGRIDQPDGTAWMAAYALNLMRIALELAAQDHVYEAIGARFFEHFLYISDAIIQPNEFGCALWDNDDEFFYDVLNLPNGEAHQLKVRSIVGLIPLFAVQVLEPSLMKQLPELNERLQWFIKFRPNIADHVSRWTRPGLNGRFLLSLLRRHRMAALLKRILDSAEFLSDYGIRSVSKYHDQNPYFFEYQTQRFGLRYLPAESDTRIFGGNSNWRGPIWMPINFLLVESLREFYLYYGDSFMLEFPSGSGKTMNLNQIADQLAIRLCNIFLLNTANKRPGMSAYERMQASEADNHLILFHEYFHGDTGQGLGAAHQTGWSALVALLIQQLSLNNAA